MKKVLASVLAIVMAVGMTSMAFAATEATGLEVNEKSRFFVSDDEGEMVKLTPDQIKSLDLRPGDTLYVELMPFATNAAGEKVTTDLNVPTKLPGQQKIVLDWTRGKEMVGSSEITTKKYVQEQYVLLVNDGDEGLLAVYESEEEGKKAIYEYALKERNGNEEDAKAFAEEIMEDYGIKPVSSYVDVAAITMVADYSGANVDMVGTLKIVRKTSSNSAEASKVALNGTVGYPSEKATDSHEVDNDRPVLKFDDLDGEAELLFGDVASFTINVRNQSALHLGYNTKPNMDVVNQNDAANIDFVTFERTPTFNRTGSLRLFADEGKFVYELSNDTLKAVNATYDEDYDAYLFETRTLGAFMISDKELSYNGTAVGGGSSEEGNESSSSGSEDDKKPTNPSTGASDMMNISMAMAAMALVGVGAIVTKKNEK